jgi:anti-anti-sigma factor
MLRFDIEDDITKEKTLVCSFPNRMDTENCQKVETDIFDKVQESQIPVVFNLEEVDYVASMFLRLCIQIAKKVGTENFSIINLHPNVKKVFMLAGFDKQLNIW